MRRFSKTGLVVLSSAFTALFPMSGAMAAGPGVLETSTGVYEFTPTVCGIHKEDGVDDIEIHGPGKAPDGEIFFFELSSTGNHVVVELGVDQPFASSERRIQAGRHVSAKFAIEVSGRTVTVPELILVDENGQPVDAAASLRIDCGT